MAQWLRTPVREIPAARQYGAGNDRSLDCIPVRQGAAAEYCGSDRCRNGVLRWRRTDGNREWRSFFNAGEPIFASEAGQAIQIELSAGELESHRHVTA